jgi:hypothetical protein
MLKSGESSEEHSRETLYESFYDINMTTEAKVERQNSIICFVMAFLITGAIVSSIILYCP